MEQNKKSMSLSSQFFDPPCTPPASINIASSRLSRDSLSWIKKAIFSTLIYSDIFDYPLTEEELEYYCTSKISHSDVKRVVHQLVTSGDIISQHNFYCLKGRKSIIKQRQQRQEISKKKLYIARQIGKKLQIIPTIKLIGISGSLAMQNAKEDDDIDLFIITHPGTIWSTRLFVSVLLQLLGKRRKRQGENTSDTICTNMFIDDACLSLPAEKQNMFIAHEIVQMKPLVDKNNTYQKFLYANKWIKRFLPNTMIGKHFSHHHVLHTMWFERILKKIQLWYMKRHRTTEYITDTILAFHPENQEKRVLDAYKRKLKAYAI